MLKQKSEEDEYFSKHNRRVRLFLESEQTLLWELWFYFHLSPTIFFVARKPCLTLHWVLLQPPIKCQNSLTNILIDISIGTIHILRKHIFIIFGLCPLPSYTSMFLLLKISTNWHFLTPPLTGSYVIYEWSHSRDVGRSENLRGDKW